VYSMEACHIFGIRDLCVSLLIGEQAGFDTGGDRWPKGLT
jgi:hypothetical protein